MNEKCPVCGEICDERKTWENPKDNTYVCRNKTADHTWSYGELQQARATRAAEVEAKVRAIAEQVKAIPRRNYYWCDRYDAGDAMVLHLWDNAGTSYDVRIPHFSAPEGSEHA